MAPSDGTTTAWSDDSGQRWAESADQRDRVLASVLDLLVEAAAPARGEAVLDIGCGCGATTLAAAHAVGVDGHVVGVDISAPMLEVARQRVHDAGLGNVTFELADVQTHPLSAATYDLAISRFGTMFFHDPRTAFTNVVRALRPGGRLCVVTWQPLATNEWLMVPRAELLRFGRRPEVGPDSSGMFAHSDPEQVGALLRSAGFADVEIRPVTVPIRLGEDVDAATNYLADLHPSQAVLETIPAADQQAALAAVRDALAPHLGDRGVHLDGAVLVTEATV